MTKGAAMKLNEGAEVIVKETGEVRKVLYGGKTKRGYVYETEGYNTPELNVYYADELMV